MACEFEREPRSECGQRGELMQRVVGKILRAVADYDPDYYDMYADPNERFFAQLYIDRISEAASAIGIRPPATEPGAPRDALGGDGSAGVGGRPRPTLLEAGCQAGRLVIPFAQRGFQVAGIDTSGFALRRARAHAREAGVSARFVQGDLMEELGRHPEWQYDIVVCAEVVYQSTQWRLMVERLAGAVRPGGLLCVSHRPKFYYLVEAMKRGGVEATAMILREQEGALQYYEPGYYNWQTPEELETFYGSLGLRWLGPFPVDRFAWLAGVDPSQLTDEQRARLLALERAELPTAACCARYVGVLAQRLKRGATG